MPPCIGDPDIGKLRHIFSADVSSETSRAKKKGAFFETQRDVLHIRFSEHLTG